MTRFSTVTALLCLAAGTPALAQPAPRFLPGQDAAIGYRSSGSDPNLPSALTIRYSAASDRLRIEGGPLGYLLVDRPAERIELVVPQMNVVLPVPPGGGITRGFVLGNLGFRATGATDTVLGRACRIYEVTAERAHGRACLTADGLLLRGEGQGSDGRNARIEAVSVSLAPQPAALFAPPQGATMLSR